VRERERDGHLLVKHGCFLYALSGVFRMLPNSAFATLLNRLDIILWKGYIIYFSVFNVKLTELSIT